MLELFSLHRAEQGHECMAEQKLIIGRDNAVEAIAKFFANKSRICLVTGGASYGFCGAEEFIADSLRNCAHEPGITHLAVRSANPNVGTVQGLLSEIRRPVDGFIAVGGGTVIDTAKLLNLAIVSERSIKELLNSKTAPSNVLPCFAVPTTAGTGAEATRFAVCYEGETKYSIDFEVIRPSIVALVTEFPSTQTPYQNATTNFDAYAQAVESLWAKGATDESKRYANRALALMNEDKWLEASYWAGRAIDISRTTAAHAFSYYLTSHYGIPHGHAVYMVFEYICRNNGHPEYIKTVPELKTLREFAAEKGMGGPSLVEELFAHVNPKRLGNNPVEVRKESFNV